MTTDVPMEELLKKTGSIFKLCIVAAKRTAELNQGAKPRVEVSRNVKASTVALWEILQDKVKIVQKAAHA